MAIRGKRSNMTRFGLIGLVWLVSVDAFGNVPLGPISLSGALTIGTAALCLALVLMVLLTGTRSLAGSRVIQRPGGRIPLPLTIFAGYAIVRLLTDPSVDGLQNVSVYVAFVAGAAVVSLTAPAEQVNVLLQKFRFGAVLATLVFLATLAGGIQIYSARAFALSCIIFVALLIPLSGQGLIGKLAPFVVVLAAFLSLSRTAAVISGFLLVFLAVRRRKAVRLPIAVFFSAAVGAGVFWAVTSFAPFRDRFLGGDAALSIGGMAINTSGRYALWEATIKSAEHAPLFGGGTGSSSAFITATFHTISHPHNEYLRLYHDFGLVGAGLFVIGMVMLCYRIWIRARRTDRPIHWTALIGLFGVMIAALTDNIIVYPFVMFPLGVLVGASLAQPLPAHSLRTYSSNSHGWERAENRSNVT